MDMFLSSYCDTRRAPYSVEHSVLKLWALGIANKATKINLNMAPSEVPSLAEDVGCFMGTQRKSPSPIYKGLGGFSKG